MNIHKNSIILFLFTLLLALPLLVPIEVFANTNTEKSDAPVTILAVPTVENLHVRSGPSTSFSSLGLIQPEEAFPILQEQGKWVQIQYSETETGWIAGWLIEKREGEANRLNHTGNEAIIHADILNVREQPSISAPIIDKLKEGQAVRILKVSEGWYYISWLTSTQTERNGWIAGQYAEMNDSPSSPTTPPAPTTPAQGSDGTQPEQPANTYPTQVLVAVDVLNVRSAPRLDSEIVKQVKMSSVLSVLSQEKDWFQIQLEEPEQSGWVASWLVESANLPIQNQPMVTILTDGTNLRSGPGLDYEVLTHGQVGDKYPIITQENDWFKLQLTDGTTAYVAGWVVGITGLPPVDIATQQKILQDKVIVIDPGHGGKDQGAKGPYYGTLEKTINLKISKVVVEKLKAAGATVIMTRQDDTYIPLQGRVDVAHHYQAHAFVSIHHNTIKDPSIRGTMVYYHTKDINARFLASTMVNEVVNQTQFRNMGARYGNYYVLRENSQLAVLIELGFLTNQEEERTINTDTYVEQAAEGIFQGLIKYFAFHK
ncbi:N-acetylmuramoyl-L-alanine amidase [Rubeoparvulum massiliense]|uniref:N-acetylmuramoyl-L-alanine amidase n=1 Tax=Rubeoparvulum massiliense TaxID=1631346 RepID=UPI00065E02D2|nr:N-acetylmuramoyl-L-alanine amidase [Rubeoparvulum massiliense]